MISFVFFQTDIVIYSRELQCFLLIRIYTNQAWYEQADEIESGSNQSSPKLGIKIKVGGGL